MLNTYRRALGSVIKSEYLNLVEENFDADQWLKEVEKEAIIDITRDGEPCIFSVPQTLINDNPEAYIPQIVSLGPYHFGKPELRAMEEHKSEAVRRIRRRMGRERFDGTVERIKSMEQKIRRCYDRDIAWNGQTLSWIMVRDGSFLLEFLRFYARNPEGLPVSWDCHPIFGNNSSLETKGIRDDVVKLENQIPLFVLKEILTTELDSEQSAKDLLECLVIYFCVWGTLFSVPWGENDPHIPPDFPATTIIEIFHSIAASDRLEQMKSTVGCNCNWMPDFICNSCPWIPTHFPPNDAAAEAELELPLVQCALPDDAILPMAPAEAEDWQGKMEIGGPSLGSIGPAIVSEGSPARPRADAAAETEEWEAGDEMGRTPLVFTEIPSVATSVKLQQEAEEGQRRRETDRFSFDSIGLPIIFDDDSRESRKAGARFEELEEREPAETPPSEVELELEEVKPEEVLPPAAEWRKAGVGFKALKLKHPEILPRAVELKKIGVKFEKFKGTIRQIRFEKRSSTLFLPVIAAGPLADTMLRNLVAFECSSPSRSELPITRYVQFMDELIDNEMDAALLREKGIVRSSVGRDALTAELFNPVERIALYARYDPIDRTRKGLLEHRRRKWKIRVHEFYEANCSKSWLVISGIAAAALIVMTFFQVLCLFCECNPKHRNLYH